MRLFFFSSKTSMSMPCTDATTTSHAPTPQGRVVGAESRVRGASVHTFASSAVHECRVARGFIFQLADACATRRMLRTRQQP